MSAYIIQPNFGKVIKSIVQPSDLITIGSNPVNLLPKTSDFLVTQIWLNLTAGTTPYDFGPGALFGFQGNGGNFVCNSAAYTLQVIQIDELNVSYLNNSDGFKIGSFAPGNQSLNLTTADGTDATQGDGVLTAWLFGFDLT